MIKIHPSAKDNYNKKCSEFLTYFGKAPPREENTTKTDRFVAANITEKDLLAEIEYVLLSSSENITVGFTTVKDKVEYMIEPKNYNEIKKVIENITKLETVQTFLSEKYVEQKLIEWLVRKFKEETTSNFIEYLIEKGNSDIVTQDIFYPIPFTSSQNEFTLGKFYFQNVSSKILDEWFSIIKRNDYKVAQLKEKMQREYQGNLFAKITITAESEKAKEIGYSELSKTLSVLRFISPAVFHPLWINGAYEYGWNMYESEKVVFFSEKNKKFSITENIRDSKIYWEIDKEALDYICEGKNNKFQQLLTTSNPSSFQSKLINGLTIYSKSVLKRDISDKLIYVLVALESLLLKNENEPIQQNLSDRIALIFASETKKRKETVQIIKKIYSIRSKFIHHGQPTLQQIETLKSFLYIAWMTMNILIENHRNFNTKEDYLEKIDDLKYK